MGCTDTRKTVSTQKTENTYEMNPCHICGSKMDALTVYDTYGDNDCVWCCTACNC